MESNEIKIKEMIVNVLENYLFNNNRREVVDSEDFQDIANDIVKELHSLSHPTNVSEENNVLYIYGEYKNHLKEMSNSGKIPLHFEQWYSLYCPTSPIKEQSDAVEFAEWLERSKWFLIQDVSIKMKGVLIYYNASDIKNHKTLSELYSIYKQSKTK